MPGGVAKFAKDSPMQDYEHKITSDRFKAQQPQARTGELGMLYRCNAEPPTGSSNREGTLPRHLRAQQTRDLDKNWMGFALCAFAHRHVAAAPHTKMLHPIQVRSAAFAPTKGRETDGAAWLLGSIAEGVRCANRS